MFFKPKRKNRRLDSDFVLDVKLRADQVRGRRARFTITVFAATIAALSLLLGVWRGGQWIMDSLIYSNDAFAVRQIDIQTDGVIAEEKLREWSTARLGQNLLALDLLKVKQSLEAVPYIDTASVERILPHTLKLRVFEREPVAQALAPVARASGEVVQTVFQIDEAGCVMPPIDPGWRARPPRFAPDQLPILVGVPGVELVSGGVIVSPSVQAGLRLVAEFNRSSMASFVDLQWIDVADPSTVQTRTRQGSDVTFSPDNYPLQLRRWQQIYELYSRSGKLVTSLNLSISNNVPLRWAEANGLPPALPKPVKPPRNRRKNV